MTVSTLLQHATLGKSDHSGTYAAADQVFPKLYYPSHLRRTRVKLHNGHTQPFRITVAGHSLVDGYDADGTNTTPENIRARYGYVGCLRKKMAVRLGDTGPGGIKLNDYRITVSGSPTAKPSIGPMLQGYLLNGPTDIVTLALDAAYDDRNTAFEIVQWQDTGTGTLPVSYSVNGGSYVAAAAGSGSDNYYSVIVDGLPDGANTIAVRGNAAGNSWLSHIIPYRGTAGGIVTRYGVSGFKTADLIGVTASLAPTSRNRLLRALTYKADLLIVDCLINDQGSQVPLATFAANLQEVIDVQVAAGGDVLLIGDPSNPNAAAGLTEADYNGVLLTLAAQDHVAYGYIGDVWGTTAQGHSTETPLQVTGSVHPTQAGGDDMASIIESWLWDKPLVHA